MNFDWLNGKLGDFVELKRGYDLPSAKRRPGRVPLVSSSGISDTHDVAMVSGPGVVTGRYGTIGQVFYVDSDYWPLNTTLYVKDFKGNDPKFISYFLKTIDFFAYSDKAAVPGVNRNHLHEAKVRIPAIRTQKKIAKLLGLLDEQIENLSATNKTLADICQTVFKAWFINFEPIKVSSKLAKPTVGDSERNESRVESSAMGLQERPQNWLEYPLYDCAQFINGASYKAFGPNFERRGKPIIKISELKSGVTSQTAFSDASMADKYRIETGEILFSWSGNPDTSIDTFVWPHDEAWLNQHIFKVVPYAEEERSFVIELLRHLKPVFIELARNKQTTGLGHVTVANLKQLMVIKPDGSALRTFATVVGPIHKRMLLNDQKASALGTLRDTLLPRLMSGQITLEDIPELLQAA
jgi:type I restriction enzyme S subunit